jgi:hypothetical protein
MSRARIWMSALFQFIFGAITASFAAFLGLGVVVELLEIAGWLSEDILRIWGWSIIICGVTFGWLTALRTYRDLLREDIVQRGVCDICGYDLRASPDRCPECGATVRIKPRKKK